MFQKTTIFIPQLTSCSSFTPNTAFSATSWLTCTNFIQFYSGLPTGRIDWNLVQLQKAFDNGIALNTQCGTVSLTDTHFRILPHTIAHYHRLSLTPTHSLIQTHTLTHSHTLSQNLAHSQTPSLTITHYHTLSRTIVHYHALSLTPTHSRAVSHTHSLTLTLSAYHPTSHRCKTETELRNKGDLKLKTEKANRTLTP